jgi:hypothetical protein
MRSAVLALLCSACCFPLDGGQRSEWVRVRVPVYTGPAEVHLVDQPQLTSVDACERPAPDISQCHPVAYVRSGAIVSEPNCYLDNKVKTGDVGRVLECPGNGALVVFDGATFVGESVNGYVNVCKSTAYDFPQGDQCTWRTEQRISGALGQGGLAYAYNEAPVAGHACTLACRARADVAMVRAE